jgi:hypothetical protein
MSLTGAECDVRNAGLAIIDIESAWMFIACQQLRGERQLELLAEAPSRPGEEGRDA